MYFLWHWCHDDCIWLYSLGVYFGHLKIHVCCTLKFLDCLHKWCLIWLLWPPYEVSQLGLSIYSFICVYTSAYLCICLWDHTQLSQPVKGGLGTCVLTSDPEVFLSMHGQNMAPALLNEIVSRHEMLAFFSFLAMERWVSGEWQRGTLSAVFLSTSHYKWRAKSYPKKKKKTLAMEKERSLALAFSPQDFWFYREMAGSGMFALMNHITCWRQKVPTENNPLVSQVNKPGSREGKDFLLVRLWAKGRAGLAPPPDPNRSPFWHALCTPIS